VSCSKENEIFEDIFLKKIAKRTILKKKLSGHQSRGWCVLTASGAVAVARHQPHAIVARGYGGVGKLNNMKMAKPVPCGRNFGRTASAARVARLQSRPKESHLNNQEVFATCWRDNKVVTLLSTFVEIDPMSKVKRFSKTDNKSIEIDCPNIVNVYNKHMGGVDPYWIAC